MARADLLTRLVKFGVNGDKVRFRKVAETIITEERAKRHTVLADSLEKLLQQPEPERNPVTNGAAVPLSTGLIDNLILEVSPQKQLDDLILPEEVNQICREVMDSLYHLKLLRGSICRSIMKFAHAWLLRLKFVPVGESMSTGMLS